MDVRGEEPWAAAAGSAPKPQPEGEAFNFLRDPMSRARFLKTVGKAGLIGSFGMQIVAASVASAASTQLPKLVPDSAQDMGHLPLRYLSTADAETVAAMAERIFPADANGPGATDARVVDYIDGQLAGGFGRADRTYLNGPYLTPGDPFHGWQYPMTPREMYRLGLDALATYVSRQYRGQTFTSLSAKDQDAVLTAMAAGKIPMLPASDVFFALFQSNVLEGLFSDPAYGGNRNFVGWKWVRFPGDPMAYGDVYFEFIDKFNVIYNVSPAGLATTQY